MEESKLTLSQWVDRITGEIALAEEDGYTILPTAHGILIYPDGKIYASIKLEW